MESSWTPPTSSTNWPSRRGVMRTARGLARCWRSRKRVVTARSGTAGRDMSIESTIAAANRWLACRLCATLGSHGRPRSYPALARRGARRVRVHLRCGRGDAVDGPWGERARRPFARTLRPRGGGAAHPRSPREGRGARLLLHPRVDGRALPGLPARAPRLRQAHPAPVDRAALRHRRALAPDRPALRLPPTGLLTNTRGARRTGSALIARGALANSPAERAAGESADDVLDQPLAAQMLRSERGLCPRKRILGGGSEGGRCPPP